MQNLPCKIEDIDNAIRTYKKQSKNVVHTIYTSFFEAIPLHFQKHIEIRTRCQVPALMKSIHIDNWVAGTSNRLFIRGF